MKKEVQAQVLCHWQQTSLEELATRLPHQHLEESSSAVMLIQSLTSQHQLQNHASVLLVGDPCMDAVVVVKKPVGLHCLTCSNCNSCRHVKAIKGDTVTDASLTDARLEKWLHNFDMVFDKSTGQRRVTSISQVVDHAQPVSLAIAASIPWATPSRYHEDHKFCMCECRQRLLSRPVQTLVHQKL